MIRHLKVRLLQFLLLISLSLCPPRSYAEPLWKGCRDDRFFFSWFTPSSQHLARGFLCRYYHRRVSFSPNEYHRLGLYWQTGLFSHTSLSLPFSSGLPTASWPSAISTQAVTSVEWSLTRGRPSFRISENFWMELLLSGRSRRRRDSWIICI